MARLGLWDKGLSALRCDTSRAFVARRALRLAGRSYRVGDDIPRLSPTQLRRLFLARRIGYSDKPPLPPAIDRPFIPDDWARLPFFSLRSLARKIAGKDVQTKEECAMAITAELADR